MATTADLGSNAPFTMQIHLALALTFSFSATPWTSQVSQATRPGGQVGVAATPKARGRMLVSGYNSNAIHVFDTATGAHEMNAAPVNGAQSIVTGPDGLLYVCAESDNQVIRIDPETMANLGAFVEDDLVTPQDESGGLSGPTGAIFGPDGHLYVASFNTDEILRFDGATGAFLDVFVTAGLGTLNGPDAGIAFGPDGHLYVPSYWNNRVVHYDGESGADLGIVISAQPSGLSRPRAVVFHEGLMYVASSGNGRILRYELTGAFIDVFANSAQPYSLAFHPDTNDLYVVNLGPNRVSRHDGVTGQLISRPVSSGEGGLAGATFVHFLIP